MKSKDYRNAESEDTSKYENRASHVSASNCRTFEQAKSMAEMRSEITRLGKIDSMGRVQVGLRLIRNKKMKEGKACGEVLGWVKPACAVWDWTKVIDYDPHVASAYDARGLAYAALGELKLALEDFTNAITLSPNEAWFYIHRGHAHFTNDDDKLAVKDLDAAISLDPENAGAYYYRGLVHVSRADYKLALFDLSKALALDPEESKYYCNRGNVYNELDQREFGHPRLHDGYTF